jgi:hypothetical protein
MLKQIFLIFSLEMGWMKTKYMGWAKQTNYMGWARPSPH